MDILEEESESSVLLGGAGEARCPAAALDAALLGGRREKLG